MLSKPYLGSPSYPITSSRIKRTSWNKPPVLYHNLTTNKKTESVNFQELGLSGLSTLTNPNISFPRKVFWSCLWLAALVLCLYECTTCIITFASTPFTVDVKFKSNNSMTAPYITLCPTEADFRNPAVSPVLLRKRSCDTSYGYAVELLSKCNLTIDALWNISRFDMQDPLYRLFATDKWMAGIKFVHQEDIEKVELLTIHGVCLMFKMNIPLPCTGQQNGLDIEGHALPNETEVPGYYSGTVHSEAEIPLIRYTGTINKGYYAAYKQLTTIAVRVQQVIHLNTWKNPCQSDEEHVNCLIQCIENKIISNSKGSPCRLPYMNERLPLPPCKSEEEMLDMYEATQTAVNEANPDNCSCIKPCNKVHYREDYFISYPVPHMLGMYLIIPQCDIEVIEDQLSYDFTSFLSDIGGDLGLFLGMSILSIFEVLEVLVRKTVLMARLLPNSTKAPTMTQFYQS